MGKTIRNKGSDKKHGGKNRPNDEGGNELDQDRFDDFDRAGKFDDYESDQRNPKKKFDNRGK